MNSDLISVYFSLENEPCCLANDNQFYSLITGEPILSAVSPVEIPLIHSETYVLFHFSDGLRINRFDRFGKVTWFQNVAYGCSLMVQNYQILKLPRSLEVPLDYPPQEIPFLRRLLPFLIENNITDYHVPPSIYFIDSTIVYTSSEYVFQILTSDSQTIPEGPVDGFPIVPMGNPSDLILYVARSNAFLISGYPIKLLKRLYTEMPIPEGAYPLLGKSLLRKAQEALDVNDILFETPQIESFQGKYLKLLKEFYP